MADNLEIIMDYVYYQKNQYSLLYYSVNCIKVNIRNVSLIANQNTIAHFFSLNKTFLLLNIFVKYLNIVNYPFV